MDDDIFLKRQIAFMESVIRLHNMVNHIHVSLEKLYPITVINDGYFFVYDKNEIGDEYKFMRKVETSIVASGDILTTFNLNFYDLKPSVVISKNMLGNPGNNILVLHEFVHCFQLEHGALGLKNELLIQKQEMVKNNYNWEVDFPFPYKNAYFIDRTKILSNYLVNGKYKHDDFVIYRNCMRTYLHKVDYEYMIWQSWKEGFARYVENLIRKEVGLRLNANILIPPYDRVVFLEIGSKYIETLIESDEELNHNIIALFYKMFTLDEIWTYAI